MYRALSPLVVVAALAGCGGGGPRQNAAGPEGPDDPTPAEQGRSALQIRQEAACEAAGPRITGCAVKDAMAQSADVRAQADPEHTAQLNTREFIKACTAAVMSSRQVRVYEVCLREETECEPLLACLDNFAPGEK